MKKLFTLAAALCLAAVTFGQDAKSETQTQTQPDKKAATTKSSTMAYAHEDYQMKDNQLIHCMGAKTEPLKSDVKLKNGTTISPSGLVTTKDGTKTQLTNGECVSLMGSIGDCDKMHSDEDKMHDNVK